MREMDSSDHLLLPQDMKFTWIYWLTLKDLDKIDVVL